MATFTKIPLDAEPVISVHPSFKVSEINDNIYGGFTE